jgi:hypothetical protein
LDFTIAEGTGNYPAQKSNRMTKYRVICTALAGKKNFNFPKLTHYLKPNLKPIRFKVAVEAIHRYI